MGQAVRIPTRFEPIESPTPPSRAIRIATGRGLLVEAVPAGNRWIVRECAGATIRRSRESYASASLAGWHYFYDEPLYGEPFAFASEEA